MNYAVVLWKFSNQLTTHNRFVSERFRDKIRGKKDYYNWKICFTFACRLMFCERHFVFYMYHLTFYKCHCCLSRCMLRASKSYIIQTIQTNWNWNKVCIIHATPCAHATVLLLPIPSVNNQLVCLLFLNRLFVLPLNISYCTFLFVCFNQDAYGRWDIKEDPFPTNEK